MNTPLDDAARGPLLQLLASAEDANQALATLLAEETRLLRAGTMKDALALAPQKAALTLAHTRAAHAIRHHAVALHRHARTETLAYREQERNLLKAAEVNVRLLTTLRAALDTIMRQALNSANGPSSPYARNGTTGTPSAAGHRLLSVRS